MVNFRSDNAIGARPAMFDALRAAADGADHPYGDDRWTRRLTDVVSRLFDRECAILPVPTGTAANALAVSLIAAPEDVVLAAPDAHVIVHEQGAAPMYSGARLVPFDLDALPVPPPEAAAVSITQLSDAGARWPRPHLHRVGAWARAHDLRMHMDGARLANALAGDAGAPADMTWRAGVDVLSLGASKNGTLNADLLVVFNTALADDLRARATRGGVLTSKMRFLSAQLLAYFDGDAWLETAAAANTAAAALETALAGAGIVPLRPVDGNVIFVEFAPHTRDRLAAAGITTMPWPIFGSDVVRLVTSYATTSTDIAALIGAL